MSTPSPSDASARGAGSQIRRIVRFKLFRAGMVTPWEELCEEAGRFASTLPPADLISISHSDSHHRGVVAVWYWSTRLKSEE